MYKEGEYVREKINIHFINIQVITRDINRFIGVMIFMLEETFDTMRN